MRGEFYDQQSQMLFAGLEIRHMDFFIINSF